MTQQTNSPLLRQLKHLRPRQAQAELDDLFNPETETYTRDFDEMVSIIKQAALERQGQDWSDPSLGEDLLRDWGLDLSNCRTELHLVEIITILI